MLINKPLILSTGTGVAPAFTIDQSIRFNDGDSAYMHRTPSGAGDRRTFTYSVWFKLGDMATSQRMLLSVRNSDTTRDNIMINQGNAGDYRIYFDARVGGSAHTELEPTRALRDPSAWYHLVVSVDTTNAVSTERVRLYLNGARETAFTTQTLPSLNQQFQINNTDKHSIGRFEFSSPQSYWDGYMAEMVMIDGQALDPSSFGEYNSSNIWIPKDVSGLTFGTNGFHIDGRDSADLGDDESGNGNDFTTGGLASHDQVADSPTNNFAVLSSISNAIDETLSNGNLQIAYGSAVTRTGIYAPYGMTSGKWYWEVYNQASGGNRVNIGIASTTENDSATRSTSIGYYPGYTAVGWSYFGFNGNKINNSSASSYGDTFTVGDIIGVAYDADNGDLFFYKNGTIQNSGTAAYTGLSTSETYYPAIGDGSQAETMTCQMNFGQEGTFAGNVTAGGNSDGNGIGNFKYSVPSGYLALCTKNLGS